MYFAAQKINKILKDLKKYIYRNVRTITLHKIAVDEFETKKMPDPDSDVWEDFLISDRWGGIDTHCWFMIRFCIPDEFDGKPVIYRLLTGREGQWDATNPQFMIYVNDRMVQGLDVNHQEVLLTGCAKAGDTYTIGLYAYSGMNEGLFELKSSIAGLDTETEKLYYHIKVPYDVAILLEEEDKRRIDILKFLNGAVGKLDLRKPFSKEYDSSVSCAVQYLEKEFYGSFCGKKSVTALAVGHTHIDVAWLWTLAQTREKAARSFSTVLNLMKQYPEYIFMSSQPQLYKFVKEDYPEIYEEIKIMVEKGRWEPEGAMWLEADCNLASGESLVRQVLFGTRFFENEFGVKSKILWLPDVFGYSAALPQILKKSGIDYFMTTKISWNEYNKMPYDTFMWRGLDGSEVLTHFVTTQDYDSKQNSSHITTYNGNLIPSQVMGAWNRYQQKEINDQVLISFGYGDGGGGPTKEMLENARRMEMGIPGCPQVIPGKSMDFFRRLEESVSNSPYLPRWVGELYLEYHRGTYTSMARNKKYNRKSEFLYQDAELFSAINSYAAQNGRYPREILNKGWEIILLNQFHDILPGSSIEEVYEDSKTQYIEVLKEGNQLLRTAIAGIASRIALEEVSVVVTNQLGYLRTDLAEFQLPPGYQNVEVWDKDHRVPHQFVGETSVIFMADNVPPKGYKVFSLRPVSPEVSESKTGNVRELIASGIQNQYFHIRFDEQMNITSIFDKTNEREVLKPGERGNVLLAFEDRPHNFDAWDINIYYQEKKWEINDVKHIRMLEDGPVRTVIEVERRFLDSALVQKICLYKHIPRIDFVNRIDWRESQILLKTAFPVDIHAEKATYEIQYGNVERPTHWNTSWDYARFEVCAHKWADVSEDDYGISLMNDCKFGYDIKDGVMRLTLLKSAIEPNPNSDREVHEFTYSLYPHRGDWKDAGTVLEAYSLNCPLVARVEPPHTGILPKEFSIIRLNRENVIIEVVKQAEDSEDIILRLYECYNRRTQVKADFYKKLHEVWECDLMENELNQVEVQECTFKFEINPYEIKTFKLKI